MSFFRDKVVVVTGGTNGIGRALVDTLVAQGAKVATCSRNYDKLYQLQLLYSNVLLHAVTCDVSKEDDCKRFIQSTLKTFGAIDILINNAGVSMRALFKDTELEVMHALMDVNFWGAVYCTKFALPSIIERKGTILGISSVAGSRGLPGRTGYSASKHALQGWLEALRTELRDDGVNVMWISPGYTSTNIRNVALNQNGEAQGESPMDESKMMSPEQCAGIILEGIKNRRRNMVMTFTGWATVFVNKLFPRIVDKYAHQFFFKNGELIK